MFTRVIHTDASHIHFIQQKTKRKQLVRGLFFAPASLWKHKRKTRPFPISQHIIKLPFPTPPFPLPHFISTIANTNLHCLANCTSDSSLIIIYNFIKDLCKEEKAESEQFTAHRLRRSTSSPNQHVSLGLEDYSTTVQTIIKHGFALRFNDNGTLQISYLTPTISNNWGFNNTIVLQDASKLYWPDKELLLFLQYGFFD